VRASLAHGYGLAAISLLERADGSPHLLGRIHPGGADIWAQVAHARDHEWAATEDDVLRGRTTVALRGHDGEDVRARVRELLGQA